MLKYHQALQFILILQFQEIKRRDKRKEQIFSQNEDTLNFEELYKQLQKKQWLSFLFQNWVKTKRNKKSDGGLQTEAHFLKWFKYSYLITWDLSPKVGIITTFTSIH